MKCMSGKTLLYKLEYENIARFSNPNFTPEEIGHILLTIGKGIIKGPMEIPVFGDEKYRLKQFPASFRNVMENTQLDITFIYILKTPVYDKSRSKIVGFKVDDDKKKVDIVSFFTKIKDSKCEHRIYQISGRYSEAMEDARVFEHEIKNNSKEDILRKLEVITTKIEFKNYHPSKKLYYLIKLRELYRQINNDKLYWKIQREIEEQIDKRLKDKKLDTQNLEINENPFNVALERFEFLKSDQAQVSRTKSLLYKHELDVSKEILDITVDNIAAILVNIQMIPHYVDFEEKIHTANFRGVVDETRKDLIFHYVHSIPLFDTEKTDEKGFALITGYKAEKITKVDIVSFISENKEGRKEHRVYQIGRRYAAENLTFDDFYGLGDANYELENYNQALEFFDQALAINQNDNDTLVFKGLTLVCLEEYDSAIKLYKQVLKSEPNDPITWDNLGLAYEYKKEYDNAKEAYQKAHELDPDDSEIKDHLEDIQNK